MKLPYNINIKILHLPSHNKKKQHTKLPKHFNFKGGPLKSGLGPLHVSESLAAVKAAPFCTSFHFTPFTGLASGVFLMFDCNECIAAMVFCWYPGAWDMVAVWLGLGLACWPSHSSNGDMNRSGCEAEGGDSIAVSVVGGAASLLVSLTWAQTLLALMCMGCEMFTVSP